MPTNLQRKIVVQHLLSLAQIAEDLSARADRLTKEIDTLAEALDIQCEFVPFDDDFPDPSIAE